MNGDSLARAVEEWFELALQQTPPDPAAFARSRGVDPDLFQERMAGAHWLVGRHQRARAGTGSSLPPLPFRLGEFELLEEAGRGGMGIVFRGVQVALGRPVAVKVLNPAIDDARGRQRFLQEARAAARLRHPHVVAVVSVGEQDGLAWLATEWVEGQSLAALLRAARDGARRDELHHLATARLIARIAAALQHAHEQGLLHRDVKPGNVMVDAQGEPHLLDFGLVKDLTAATMTGTGEVLGSPAYMSPEQLAGRLPTSRSDVYSLGVTLYECLTLRRPFEADTSVELQRRIQTGEPTLPQKIDPAIPDDLQWICCRAIAPEPAERYPSAAAFAADLEAFLRGEPVHAGPPTLLLRARRWLRRRRVALLAAGTVAVLGAATAMVWTNVQARIEERDVRLLWTELGDPRSWGVRPVMESRLTRAVADHPDEQGFRFLLAVHCIYGREFERARETLLAARDLGGGDVRLAELIGQGLAALRRVALQTAEASDDALLADLGRQDDGVGERQMLRGELLRLLHRHDEAIAKYQDARRLDGRLSPFVANGLIDSYVKIGNWRAARDEQKAISLQSATADMLARSVRMSFYSGDDAALAEEKRLLREQHPDSAWNEYAELLRLDGRRLTADELDALVKRAKERADWGQAGKMLGNTAADAYRAAGRPEVAVQIWREHLTRDPNDPNTLGLLGSTLLQLAERGDPALHAEGLELLERAAKCGEDRLFERDVHWGTYWFYAGDPARAAEYFASSTRLCPGDPPRWRQLAGACYRAAEKERDLARRIDWLRRGVEAQQKEADIARGSVQAWHRLAQQLEALVRVLDRTHDPTLQATRQRLDDVRSQLRLLQRDGR
jgi:tetratricopeptide (TPR) repeat protein